MNEVDRKVGPSHGRPRTDGRTRGGSRPPRTPPIASAFGDTDGEIFGQKSFRSKTFSAEKFSAEKVFGRKIFGRNFFDRKFRRPSENFALRHPPVGGWVGPGRG